MGSFECLAAEYALHESNGNHLVATEGGGSVRRVAPLRDIGMRFEIVAKEYVAAQHLIRHGYIFPSRPPLDLEIASTT